MDGIPLSLVAGSFEAKVNLSAMGSLNKFPHPDPFSLSPSTSPVALVLDGDEESAGIGCWAGSAPPFLSFSPSLQISSSSDGPVIHFFLFLAGSRILPNRSSDLFAVSWHAQFLEALGEAARQAPGSCCDGYSLPDLGVVNCLSAVLLMAANHRKTVALDSQNFMENWKIGDLNLVGCCCVSVLQDRCCFAHVVICILKLVFRGVKCFKSECFFCIMKIRADDDLPKDGGPCLLGSIHQCQVRESLLLIPRSSKQGSIRLSLVLRLQDLQLNLSLPLVHMPARLLGEPPSLWRACTEEAFEDSSYGNTLDFSRLVRHQTLVVVFTVFGLLLTVLVFSSRKVALLYALCMRVV